MDTVVTLTFGDQAENHVGMQQLGQMVPEGQGLNLEDFQAVQNLFPHATELFTLSNAVEGAPPAHVLVIRDGVNLMLMDTVHTYHDVLREQLALDWDKHAFMYGRVVNKKARWNLCYDLGREQEPDYAARRGRIYDLMQLPSTLAMYQGMRRFLGPKCQHLKGEGNLYNDPSRNGIGWHGDSERRIVVAARLGNGDMPIHYQWYQRHARVGPRITVPLRGGDIYMMSEKAVGTDWKKSSILTLRHATGANEFTK